VRPGGFLLALGLGAALFPFDATALEITNVSHDPVVLDGGAKAVHVRFRVSERATVTLRIFDGRELVVRTVTSTVPLDGEGELRWDGADEAGKPVPPEAYHYTLEARTAGGAKVEYDVTDLTGGEELETRRVDYDPAAQTVSYVLAQPARVSLRVGLKDGGPLLGTILDWVARPSGAQTEPWDGQIDGGVLDLAGHPNREIVLAAFSLPSNTIFVGGSADEVRLIQKIAWPKEERVVKRKPARRMYDHSQQKIEERGDFALRVELPKGLPKDDDGIPVVSGSVAVLVDVKDSDRERVLAQRFETVFYLDGQYLFEHEVGFLPTTVNWELADVNDGPHYLTANVRGYEGNFGAATVKVTVRKVDEPEGSEAQSKPPSEGKSAR
jgi:hypothetical protein